MNERIFELAKEADLIQWDTLPSGARTPDHESVVKAKKFAELIVKKCIESIGEVEEQFFNGRIATDDFSEKNRFAEAEIACQMAKQKIKRQFGVEE